MLGCEGVYSESDESESALIVMASAVKGEGVVVTSWGGDVMAESLMVVLLLHV